MQSVYLLYIIIYTVNIHLCQGIFLFFIQYPILTLNNMGMDSAKLL